MKRALPILVLILAITFPAESFALVKTGSACSKLGLTNVAAGKKYTCVKSGKKLVWDKGVLVKVPSPKPTPVFSPTPTPSAPENPTPTPSATPTQSAKPNPTPSPSVSPTPTVSAEPTPTPSATTEPTPLTIQEMTNAILVPYSNLANCIIPNLSSEEINSVLSENPSKDAELKIRNCVQSSGGYSKMNENSVRYLAFKQIEKRYAENSGKSGEVKIEIDPNLNQKARNLIEIGIRDAMQFWGKTQLPDAHFTAGGKDQWLLEATCGFNLRIDSQAYKDCVSKSVDGLGAGSGWPNHEPKQVQMWGAVFGPNLDPTTGQWRQSAAWGYLSTTEPSISQPALFTAATHEITHLVQWNSYDLSGTSSERAAKFEKASSANNLNTDILMKPTLWIEGSASYFGSAIANLKIPYAIEEINSTKPRWISGPIPTLDSLSKYVLNVSCPCTVEAQAERQKMMDYQYWAGALMTELMVAQFGLDKTIDFMNSFSAIYMDKTATWQSIFKDNFGVDWISWSKNADLYINDMLIGNPTSLNKYAQTFIADVTVPIAPRIDLVTPGVGSLIVNAHGFKDGLSEITKITIQAASGQNCTIVGIIGSCTLNGLPPEIAVGIKAFATNSVGNSAYSVEISGTPIAPSAKPISASAVFDDFCSQHFSFDLYNFYCFKIKVEWDHPEIAAKSDNTIDFGFGSVSLPSQGSLQFVLQKIQPNSVLSVTNKFQISSKYRDAPAVTYEGTYNLSLSDILPTIAPPIAKNIGVDQIQLNWQLNPALKGKGLSFEICEVNTIPNISAKVKVVKQGILDSESQTLLAKSVSKEGMISYVLRIQATQNQPLGANSFQSNVP